MSRNHTEYYVLKLDDEGYLEPVRMCKTLGRAKRVYAAKGAERVDKWRATPSMCYLRMAYPEKQLNQGTLKRLYRKLRRREADAKKRENRRNENIFTPALRCHYTRNMGVLQFCRYLSGVRKGTIL